MRSLPPLSGLIALLLLTGSARPDDEPTADQLKAAKAAFEKLGATYSTRPTRDKKVVHEFYMPKGTNDQLLKKLPEVPFAFELYINFPNTTDKGLKGLANQKKLRTLHIDGDRITDEALRVLRAADMLHILPCAYGPSRGFDPEPAATDDEIARLDLGRSRVTSKGMPELAGLKKLRELHLNTSQATAAALKGFGDVTALGLDGPQVTDATLKEIKGLTKLKSLYLQNTKVTDKGLKELRVFKELFALYLNGTQVTDIGLKEVAALGTLEHLDLHDTPVTDKGLAELKALTKLTSLDLLETKTTSNGVKALQAALPKCRILSRPK